MKYIDIGEFVNMGYLQEVNRQFFHPLGLALEVVIDKEDGCKPSHADIRLGGIQDHRDDPEGVAFDDGRLEVDKALSIAQQALTRAKVRKEALGYIIQPINIL